MHIKNTHTNLERKKESSPEKNTHKRTHRTIRWWRHLVVSMLFLGWHFSNIDKEEKWKQFLVHTQIVCESTVSTKKPNDITIVLVIVNHIIFGNNNTQQLQPNSYFCLLNFSSFEDRAHPAYNHIIIRNQKNVKSQKEHFLVERAHSFKCGADKLHGKLWENLSSPALDYRKVASELICHILDRMQKKHNKIIGDLRWKRRASQGHCECMHGRMAMKTRFIIVVISHAQHKYEIITKLIAIACEWGDSRGVAASWIETTRGISIVVDRMRTVLCMRVYK